MLHRRFFVPRANIVGEEARIIDEDDINHIRKVLRLSRGDKVILLDGEGAEYGAVLSSIARDQIQLKLTLPPIIHPRSKIELILIQGLPKNPKMDLIIRSSTEIGVIKIVPITTRRSIPIIKDERRFVRWQRIIREAASQSGRVYLPVIERPMSLEDVLGNYPASRDLLSIVFWEGEDHLMLRDVLRRHSQLKKVAVFIGPEGGFTEEEVGRMKERGVTSCSLGRCLLRTETASITGLAIILYELGMIG